MAEPFSVLCSHCGAHFTPSKERAIDPYLYKRVEQQRDTLIEALREIADCPNKGTKAESTDGQAWNDRAWVIQRAHHALKDIGAVEGSEDG